MQQFQILTATKIPETCTIFALWLKQMAKTPVAILLALRSSAKLLFMQRSSFLKCLERRTPAAEEMIYAVLRAHTSCETFKN